MRLTAATLVMAGLALRGGAGPGPGPRPRHRAARRGPDDEAGRLPGTQQRPGADRALLAQDQDRPRRTVHAVRTSPATSRSRAGSGDEVSIDAVKRTRGDKSELDRVQIDVDERAGRVDVQTDHGQMERRDRNDRGDHVSVDYTMVVPASVSVDLHSISGSVKVTGVHGSLRSETISGNVTITDAPRLETAKTVSGDVMLSERHHRRRPVREQRQRQRARAKGSRRAGVDLGIGERRHQRHRRRPATASASSRSAAASNTPAVSPRAAATRSTRTRATSG